MIIRLQSGLGTNRGSFLHLDWGDCTRRIGDKTQLLAFILAARFQKPLPIITGIVFATIINHGLDCPLGGWQVALDPWVCPSSEWPSVLKNGK